MRRASAGAMALLPIGPLLVVSAHYDDVPLSCAALLERGAPVTLLHVCTAAPVPAIVTEWDRRCGFRDSDEAVGARRAEELNAFAGSPHELREVGLLDAPYAGTRDRARDEGAVADAVVAWVEEHPGPCTVAVPVGAGSAGGALAPLVRLRGMLLRTARSSVHPDHVLTRDGALLGLARRPAAGVLLYEDQPYRHTRRGDSAAAEVGARAGLTPQRFDVPIDRRAKAARLGAYPSQLPHLYPAWAVRRGMLHRILPGDERYWWLRRP